MFKLFKRKPSKKYVYKSFYTYTDLFHNNKIQAQNDMNEAILRCNLLNDVECSELKCLFYIRHDGHPSEYFYSIIKYTVEQEENVMEVIRECSKNIVVTIKNAFENLN